MVVIPVMKPKKAGGNAAINIGFKLWNTYKVYIMLYFGFINITKSFSFVAPTEPFVNSQAPETT